MCWLDPSSVQSFGGGTAAGFGSAIGHTVGYSGQAAGLPNQGLQVALSSILGLPQASDALVRQAGAGAALRAQAGLGRASTFLSTGSVGDTTTRQAGAVATSSSGIPGDAAAAGPVTNNPAADLGQPPTTTPDKDGTILGTPALLGQGQGASPIQSRVEAEGGTTTSGFGASGWKNRAGGTGRGTILGGP